MHATTPTPTAADTASATETSGTETATGSTASQPPRGGERVLDPHLPEGGGSEDEGSEAKPEASDDDSEKAPAEKKAAASPEGGKDDPVIERKVNGKPVKRKLSEWIELAQKGEGAEQRFTKLARQAQELKKRADDIEAKEAKLTRLLGVLQGEDQEAAESALEVLLGKNLDAIARNRAGRQVLAEVDPEKAKALTEQSELARLRAWREREDQRARADEERRFEEGWLREANTGLVRAFDEVRLPRDEMLATRAIDMVKALKNTPGRGVHPPTPDELKHIATRLEDGARKISTSLIEKLVEAGDAEKLYQHIGEKGADMLRKRELARLEQTRKLKKAETNGSSGSQGREGRATSLKDWEKAWKEAMK